MTIHFRAANPCPQCGSPVFLEMDDEKIVAGELREVPRVIRTCPSGCQMHARAIGQIPLPMNGLPFKRDE